MLMPRPVLRVLCLSAAICGVTPPLRAATPVVVQNEAGFEGLENPSVIYFPDTNTFGSDTTFQNHIDEGGGMFRDILRNEYSTPLAPYPAGPGWWDGDAANSANTDRQRVEAKGITGLGHQQVEQTFEYSFDFRTDPTFQGTSHFCHVFQLKATNGNDGAPFATVSLYKNGTGIQGKIETYALNGSTETVPTTFTYVAGQWCHVVIRITPCAAGETTGSVLASINGSAFAGITGAPLYLTGSTDFRPKFGLYRGIGVSYGVPAGDSWVEHRTITGYMGTSNVLTWNGGLNNNTWDSATTANFLNGAAGSVFNLLDQTNFTNSSANTAVTIAGNVAPGFVFINSSQNYTFSGAGSITGGTLRKDGTGTLTLATINSYPGLTDVRNGTLFVTGSIGNNSLVSITGGTLKVGSATALGSGAIGAQINGGTLDINGFNISTEPIAVQGAGVSNSGAIVNLGASQTNALTKVTLTGDTTFGGSGRWDIRGTGATLSTGGSASNLTKTGANQVSLVGASVDAALGNIAINQGILSFQTGTTSMGDATKTVTVASGAALGFFNTTNVMNKLCTLNGGTLWAESGIGNQNTFSGGISVSSAGGVLDAGGALTGGTPNANAVLNLTGPITGTGGITKNGPGNVVISGTANTWSGGTTVNSGILTANGIVPGSVTVNNTATLRGAGSVSGLVTIASGGAISPGNSPGLLTVGSLALASGSQTNIELGGITRGSQYDAIVSSGSVSLGGTLQVSLISGFTPQPGQSFDILDWGTLAGKFSTLNLPSLTAPLGWDTSQLYTTGVLSVTPTVRGDFNRDGQVTTADIPAMLTVLTDLNAYAATNSLSPTQLATIGDFDNSTTVTNRDIQGLLDLIANLGGGAAAAVPEPPPLVLLSIGALAILNRRGRR
jgi:autotransporter-associated beta strand protein